MGVHAPVLSRNAMSFFCLQKYIITLYFFRKVPKGPSWCWFSCRLCSAWKSLCNFWYTHFSNKNGNAQIVFYYSHVNVYTIYEINVFLLNTTIHIQKTKSSIGTVVSIIIIFVLFKVQKASLYLFTYKTFIFNLFSRTVLGITFQISSVLNLAYFVVVNLHLTPPRLFHRCTSGWMMSRCTAPRRRSRGRRPSARRKRASRVSSRTNCRPSSSPPTTSSRWSSSAPRRRSWRRGSDRKHPVIGSSIPVPAFGESIFLFFSFNFEKSLWSEDIVLRENDSIQMEMSV